MAAQTALAASATAKTISASLPSSAAAAAVGANISLDYIITGFWSESGDPRLLKSALVGGGPWQMLSFVLLYLMAVKSIGPRLMRNKKPMDNLIWPIRVYNAFMVAFNTYLFVSFSRRLRFGLDCWSCDVGTQLVETQDLRLWELTLLSRYFDFLDSIFFVCRKKFGHLSTLHVVHHSIVPIIIWFATKFAATPMVVFAGYINLPVHMIMYTYYGLSTFPALRKYLWWKKYITTIQIVQFFVDLAHSVQAVFGANCKPAPISYVQFLFSVSFIYMFCQFYLRSYGFKAKIDSCDRDLSSKQRLHQTSINSTTHATSCEQTQVASASSAQAASNSTKKHANGKLD